MINRNHFDTLRHNSSQPCVTLYVPMDTTGDYTKNQIRWKNACQQASSKLEKDYATYTQILEPAFQLIKDEKFWAYQSKCLAGFYSPQIQQTFSLSAASLNKISVDDSLYISPLLAELVDATRMFILCISKNKTAFYEAVADGIYPVRIHDKVVLNFKEAMQHVTDRASLQHHSTRNGKAQFHGNSAPEDKEALRLKQYMRRIDDGLMEIIHDESVPLVLASVEEYYGYYRQVTRYPHLSNHMIVGNPDHLSPKEIHDQIQPIFREWHNKKVSEFNSVYAQRMQDDRAVDEIPQIDKAAQVGSIDQLMISPNIYDSHTFDSAKLDNTIMSAYETGASLIYTTDQEDQSSTLLKAILRFPLPIPSHS